MEDFADKDSHQGGDRNEGFIRPPAGQVKTARRELPGPALPRTDRASMFRGAEGISPLRRPGEEGNYRSLFAAELATRLTEMDEGRGRRSPPRLQEARASPNTSRGHPIQSRRGASGLMQAPLQPLSWRTSGAESERRHQGRDAGLEGRRSSRLAAGGRSRLARQTLD